MKRISFMDWNLVDSEFLGLSVVRLFVLVRERNAWHGTRSRVYPGPAGLTANRREAEREAALNRERGSSWSITEVPGIVLLSSAGPVAVAEFHSEDCFGRWDHGWGAKWLKVGKPLSTPILAFSRTGYGRWRAPVPADDSIIIGKGVRGEFLPLPPTRPLMRWRSYSDGGARPLVWEATQPRNVYSRGGVEAILHTFESVNTPAEVSDARRRYWHPPVRVADPAVTRA